MSKYGDFIKAQKEKESDFFFGKGNVTKVSTKYYEFKRVLDEENIIIVTKNIKVIKGNYVLIVDNNKAVYLKEWQVKHIHSYDEEFNGYAVKLNKKYFKPYTFKTDFEDFCFVKEDTFESLFEVAKEQEKENTKVSNGWMN